MPLPHRRGKTPYNNYTNLVQGQHEEEEQCTNWNGMVSSSAPGSNSNNNNTNRYYPSAGTPLNTCDSSGAGAPLIPSGPLATSAPQPPFITDTLTACLDTNGTYLCTPYSPRCYIIQKVTPNAVTVTPHVPGSCVIPPAPGTCSSSGNSWSSGGIAARPPPSGPLSRKSHQNAHHHHLPTFPSRRQSNDDPGGGTLALGNSTYWSDNYSKRRPGGRLQSSRPHRYLAAGPVVVEQERPLSSSCSSSSSTPSPLPMVVTVEPILQRAEIGDSELMNGEVASVSGPSGEASMPSVGLASNCTVKNSTAEIRRSEGKVVNGLEDVVISMVEGGENSLSASGSLEMTESEFADPSQHMICQDGSGQEAMVSNALRGNINSAGTAETLADIKRALLQQLEYYFSPENLANDKFLVSQMDSDHYVYISTLANFNMVKKWTSDLDFITSVLKESKNVQVHPDGKRARPVTQRTVVILRGIPEKTPVEEIKGLFENENCPKCNSCEFAFNDSWYISFDSDEDAQKAHRYLREVVKEFKGQPIMARIKSKPTTLLSQSVNLHGMKNGYHPTPVITTYNPYVPGTGAAVSAGAVAASSVYPGQQIPQVFPLSSYAGYAPQLTWSGFYDVQSAPMNGPTIYLNGMTSGPTASYTKGPSLGQRRNHAKYDSRMQGPRRMHSSNSESGGTSASGASGMGNHSSSHHQYNNNQRKNNSSNGAPQPLLGIPPTISLVSAHSGSHSHHQHHHSSASVNPSSLSQNGRPYVNHLPQSVPTTAHDYQAQVRHRAESRPRSSLSIRKGSRKDEDVAFDTSSSSQAAATIRGNPSNRPVQSQPGSPQPVAHGTADASNANSSNKKFDLASSAFPPLPGVTNAAQKNGDSPYEDRLADVVKGVKNAKIVPLSCEKDETGPTASSAGDFGTVSAKSSETVSSVASSQQLKSSGEDLASSQSTDVVESQKNFRDVGVGSADDVGDGRPPHNDTVTIFKGKETADKSTLIESTLLNGDQQATTSTASSISTTASAPSAQTLALKKKPAVQTGAVSALGNKKVVQGVQNAVPTASVTGPGEVPYSVKTTSLSSSTKNSGGSLPSIAGCSNTKSAGSNSVPAGGSGARVNGANTSGNINPSIVSLSPNTSANANLRTSDQDAFPVPGFAKTVPMNSKPFSGLTDHFPNENPVTCNKSDGEHDAEGSGPKIDDSTCSSDEGPVRLSYAQVAQTKKDKAGISSAVPPPAGSPNPSRTSNSTALTSETHVCPSATEDPKKKPLKETRERRPNQPKNGKGNGSHGGNPTERERTERSDRDRNFRRDRPKNPGKR